MQGLEAQSMDRERDEDVAKGGTHNGMDEERFSLLLLPASYCNSHSDVMHLQDSTF